jgi:putative transposase
MMRTASIRLNATPEQAAALGALRSAYAEACNRLMPIVCEHRVWNRVSLHQRAYRGLRQSTPLGSQMVCNAIFSVCKAYRAQRALGRIGKDEPVPMLRFDRASVHYDQRTYTIKANGVSLNTLKGRVSVPWIPAEHQRRILESGRAKEAELLLRDGQWFFNLVVESVDPPTRASGPVMGVDVGENTLAATSTGKV